VRIWRLSELSGIDPDLDDVIQELLEIGGAINALELAKHSGLSPVQFLRKLEARFTTTEASETSERTGRDCLSSTASSLWVCVLIVLSRRAIFSSSTTSIERFSASL
jgi:hypothetical protein